MIGALVVFVAGLRWLALGAVAAGVVVSGLLLGAQIGGFFEPRGRSR